MISVHRQAVRVVVVKKQNSILQKRRTYFLSIHSDNLTNGF